MVKAVLLILMTTFSNREVSLLCRFMIGIRDGAQSYKGKFHKNAETQQPPERERTAEKYLHEPYSDLYSMVY
jgi:hypothetical protein